MKPSAESGLQGAATRQGKAGASPCRAEVVLAVSVSCQLVFRKEMQEFPGSPVVRAPRSV